jgi:hypothetical protein
VEGFRASFTVIYPSVSSLACDPRTISVSSPASVFPAHFFYPIYVHFHLRRLTSRITSQPGTLYSGMTLYACLGRVLYLSRTVWKIRYYGKLTLLHSRPTLHSADPVSGGPDHFLRTVSKYLRSLPAPFGKHPKQAELRRVCQALVLLYVSLLPTDLMCKTQTRAAPMRSLTGWTIDTCKLILGNLEAKESRSVNHLPLSSPFLHLTVELRT